MVCTLGTQTQNITFVETGLPFRCFLNETTLIYQAKIDIVSKVMQSRSIVYEKVCAVPWCQFLILLQ
jgi:hypothetical protein